MSPPLLCYLRRAWEGRWEADRQIGSWHGRGEGRVHVSLALPNSLHHHLLHVKHLQRDRELCQGEGDCGNNPPRPDHMAC